MKRSKAGPESLKTEKSRRAGLSPVEKLTPPTAPLIAIVFTLVTITKVSRLHRAKKAIATGMKLEEIKECQEFFGMNERGIGRSVSAKERGNKLGDFCIFAIGFDASIDYVVARPLGLIVRMNAQISA